MKYKIKITKTFIVEIEADNMQKAEENGKFLIDNFPSEYLRLELRECTNLNNQNKGE
jgi:hypothetical protein